MRAQPIGLAGSSVLRHCLPEEPSGQYLVPSSPLPVFGQANDKSLSVLGRNLVLAEWRSWPSSTPAAANRARATAPQGRSLCIVRTTPHPLVQELRAERLGEVGAQVVAGASLVEGREGGKGGDGRGRGLAAERRAAGETHAAYQRSNMRLRTRTMCVVGRCTVCPFSCFALRRQCARRAAVCAPLANAMRRVQAQAFHYPSTREIKATRPPPAAPGGRPSWPRWCRCSWHLGAVWVRCVLRGSRGTGIAQGCPVHVQALSGVGAVGTWGRCGLGEG